MMLLPPLWFPFTPLMIPVDCCMTHELREYHGLWPWDMNRWLPKLLQWKQTRPQGMPVAQSTVLLLLLFSSLRVVIHGNYLSITNTIVTQLTVKTGGTLSTTFDCLSNLRNTDP
jgi:hypothetical protein